MGSIYLPAESADAWKRFLAEPYHWKKGHSAAAIAHSWQDADGFPAEIAALFQSRADCGLFPIELLVAIPEHKVPLPGGSRCSQNDVWALGRTASDLVSIAVEGKVAEPFGPTVGEWLSDSSPGKLRRIEYIKELLQLPEIPGSIRYQLCHRTASAIIEANRYHARHAVMLVHSFSRTNEWFDDFAAFAGLFGVVPNPGVLYHVRNEMSPGLYLGWARGPERFLEWGD